MLPLSCKFKTFFRMIIFSECICVIILFVMTLIFLIELELKYSWCNFDSFYIYQCIAWTNFSKDIQSLSSHYRIPISLVSMTRLFLVYLNLEAAVRRCSTEQVFLNLAQKLQENAIGWVMLINLQKRYFDNTLVL